MLGGTAGHSSKNRYCPARFGTVDRYANSCHSDHGWAQVYSTEQSNSSGRLWWLTSVSRSVSSREVRLHDQDELDWALPCESREMSTVKKKRVETFRNIRYGDGRIYY